MSRKVLLAAILVISSLTLAACGGSTPAPKAEPAKTAPAAAPAPAAPAPAAKAPAPATPAAAPVKVEKLNLSYACECLSYMAVYVSRSKDLFKANALQPEFFPSSVGGGPEVNAVVSGSAHVGISSVSNVLNAVSRGAKLKLVGAVFGKSNIQMFIHKDVATAAGFQADWPLEKKAALLKGKNVGVSAPGSLTFQFTHYLARKAGLDPNKDMTILGVGGGAGMVAALKSRKVDMAILSSPVPETAYAEGFAIPLVDFSKDVPDFQAFTQEVALVSEQLAKDNPELIRKALKTLVTASNLVVSSKPEEIVPLIKPFFKDLDDKVLLSSVITSGRAVAKDGKLEEKGVEANYNLLKSTGILQSDVNWKSLIDTQFLPKT